MGQDTAKSGEFAVTGIVIEILVLSTNSIIKPAQFIQKEQYYAGEYIAKENAATGNVTNRVPPIISVQMTVIVMSKEGQCGKGLNRLIL